MNYRGFVSTNGDEERNDLCRLSQTLASNVHKISQNVNQIQRLINELETTEDSLTLTTQLNEMQEKSAQLTRDTINCLKELAEMPQLVQSLISVDQNKRNPLINSLNASNVRKTNFLVDNNNSKQFSLEKFMTPSSLMSQKSNFYEGKTVFGGANASRAARLAGSTPYSLLQRHHLAPVLRVNIETSKRLVESNEPLSSSSQRILEKLEKAATPLQDARRIPSSAHLKNYFQTSDLLHRSSKRPKLGANPVLSQTHREQTPFEPKRWELRLSNKDDHEVSATEKTDQLISSCDNKYLSDSNENKSNETFGGKMMRKDHNREEKLKTKISTNCGLNDSLDILTTVKPLTMPSNLPIFNFTVSKPSVESRLTTVITKSEAQDLKFKFSEPLLKIRDQKSELVLPTGKNGRKPFVFSSPLSAITHKSSNESEKESNTLKQSNQESDVEHITKVSIISDNKIEINKKDTSVDKWICVCLYQNSSSDKKCRACNKDRISQFKPSTPSNTLPNANKTADSKDMKSTPPITHNTTIGWGNKFKPASGSWSCSVCLLSNPADKTKCLACEEPNPAQSKITTSTGWEQKFKLPPGSWNCSECLISNPSDKIKCMSCEEPKPGNFGLNANAIDITSADTNSKSTTNSLFAFGGKNSDQFSSPSTQKLLDNMNTNSKASSEFSFGLSSNQSTAQTNSSNLFANAINPTQNSLTFNQMAPTTATSLFSLTPSSSVKSFNSMLSSQTNPLVSTSSETSTAPLSLSNSSSPQKGLAFGNSNNNLQSFSSQPSNANKSNVSFNLDANTTAITPTTTTIIPATTTDNAFGANVSTLFGCNPNKGFTSGNSALNSSETPAFSFIIPSSNSLSNAPSNLNFGLNANAINTTSAESNSKSATNSLFAFGGKNRDQFSSPSTQKLLNDMNTNLKASSQFSFGLSSNQSTGQTNSSNLFTNAINPTQNSLTFNQMAPTTVASLFSLTPSSSIKSFDSMLSNQTNPLVSTSSETSTAPLSLSNSSSPQKGLAFGNSNNNLQSFSSQPSNATKPNFSFNLGANTRAITPTTTTDNAFGANANTLFGSNPNKGFTFGNLALNSSQTPAFSFTIPSSNSLSNTSSNLNFGLNANVINTTSAESNSKSATNSLFAFGGQNSDQFSSPSTQKLLNNMNTNSKASSQFSFGLSSNQSTGQTNSSNLFANAINPTQNSLTFNQMAPTAAPAVNPSPFTFGGFGSTPSTTAIPQMQSRVQQPQQSLPPSSFTFSDQPPTFNFGSLPTGAPSSANIFQFSADQTSQAVVATNRNIKKAKRRLNPT